MNAQSRITGFLTIVIMLTAIALPEASHAFRSTKQESFTDPDYLDYQPKAVTLTVLAENLDARKVIEERLTKELTKRGIEVYLDAKLFPPTREWDEIQRGLIYEKYSIEAGIIVGVGASSQEISQVGSQTWGNATANSYGNSATAYGNSTTTAIVSAKSNASFSAVLVDLSKNRIAWTSDIYTKASGTLFVGGKGDAKAAAKGIIKGLIENNHIPKKASK